MNKQYIIEVYTKLINEGMKTLEDVPESIKLEVENKLNVN